MEWNPLGNWSFEPTKSIKQAFLATRKNKNTILGSTSMPGLFQVHHFSIDASLFGLALLLETFGLYVLGSMTRLPLIAFLAPAMIDIGLAALHHYGVGEQKRIENKLLLIDDNNEKGTIEKMNLEGEKQKYNWIQLFSAIFIVLLAIVKIYFALVAYRKGLTAEITPALLSYVFVAIIHIRVTGYFFAGAWSIFRYNKYAKKIRKAASSDSSSSGNVHERRKEYYATTLQIEEVEHCKHYLKKKEGSDNEYEFSTFGLLTDKQVEFIVTKQKGIDSKNTVAVWCIKQQMLILDLEPQ